MKFGNSIDAPVCSSAYPLGKFMVRQKDHVRKGLKKPSTEIRATCSVFAECSQSLSKSFL